MKEKIYAFYTHIYPFQATVTVTVILTKICMEISIHSGKQTNQTKKANKTKTNKQKRYILKLVFSI